MLFTSCAQLTTGLNAARATGAYERKLATLTRGKLLVIDDFTPKLYALRRARISTRSLRSVTSGAATIVTSNLDFLELDLAFPNNRLLASATVDGLRHKAYCLELDRGAPAAFQTSLRRAVNQPSPASDKSTHS